MQLETAQKDMREMRVRLRQQTRIIFLLLVLAIIALATIFYHVGRERTIIIPAGIEKSFWVSGDKVSPTYLEQMGEHMAYLALDVSPANIDYKKSRFLAYVTPDAHGELNTRIELEAARLKRDNATSMFSIQQLTPDEDRMAVVMKGRLTTFINDRRVSEVDKAYLAEFEYRGGRISVKTFREMNDAERNATSATVAGLAVRTP